ncbi:MAG TPA: phosphopantetheine-binding protein [Alphaproteobacteria bacterium]|nr:phosphopantetheine-binding protein [Alphaproteobacteria bacterium]
MRDARLQKANSGPTTADSTKSMEREVARLLIETLNLERAPEDIAPDAPLFYDGLGLDSIDALELALAISQRYGVTISSEDEMNRSIFQSLRSLAAHIERHRVQ